MRAPSLRLVWLWFAFAIAVPVRAQVSDAPAMESGLRPKAPEGRIDEATAAAYCRATEASADSTGALLSAPWLTGSVGTVLAAEDAAVAQATDSAMPRLRLQAGIGVSPTRMWRGALVRKMATSECQRFRAAAQARQELDVVGADLGREGPAPLEAKARILSGAVERGRALLEETERRLEASLATVADYRALVLKVNALETELHRARESLAERRPRVKSSGRWASAKARVEQAELDAARLESSLRRSQAFEVVLRGGYDKVFGLEQKVPVFGQVSLRFSPGLFWQSSADERAEKATEEYSRRRLTGSLPDPTELLQTLAARIQASEERTRALERTIDGLQVHLSAISRVSGKDAQVYASLLWLDLEELKAEHAFAVAHVEDLRAIESEARGAAR